MCRESETRLWTGEILSLNVLSQTPSLNDQIFIVLSWDPVAIFSSDIFIKEVIQSECPASTL